MSKRKPSPTPIPTSETATMPLADLAPAAYNPRKISPAAMQALRASLTRFGELGGIVWNRRTGNLVGGHQRVRALLDLGETHAVVRVVDLDEATEKAANVALNHAGIGGEWDLDRLPDVLEEVLHGLPSAFDELRFGDLLADEPIPSSEPATSDRYTKTIKLPVYEPRGAKPAVADLYDDSKTASLIARIDASDAPNEVKHFLRLAAERHTAFHFARIAEYYCHADAAVQELFEESALVIIDVNKAIEYGFAAFTETMFDIVDAESDDA